MNASVVPAWFDAVLPLDLVGEPLLTPDQRIARLAAKQHGVFTYEQALGSGLTPDMVQNRVHTGRWVRIYRGVYAIAGVRLAFEGRALAAALFVGPSAVVSSSTAGRLWEFDGIHSAWIHLTAPRTRRASAPLGVRLKQTRSLPRDDVTIFRSIPVTTPGRTLIDLAAEIAEAPLEDALDSAIRRKRIVAANLLSVVRRRRRPGAAGLAMLERLLVVRVGKVPSGSLKENRLRRFIEATGLPRPVGQHTIRTDDGAFVARVDFAYPDAKLVLEFDSYEGHSSRNDWEDDLVRQNRLVDLGWLPLRITDRQLDNIPDDVLGTIWRRLAAAGAVNGRQIGEGR